MGGPFDKDAWLAKGVSKPGAGAARSASRGRAVPPKLTHTVEGDDLDPSDDELTETRTLEKRMKEISIDPLHPRFFGKSSSVMFLQTAMALKQTYGTVPQPAVGPDGRRKVVPCKRPEYWRAHSVSSFRAAAQHILTLLRAYSGS